MLAASTIAVSVVGNMVSVTDGKSTRLSSCASRSAAKSLGSRLSKDMVFARKWMRVPEPVQLDLPLGDGVELVR